MTRVKTPYFFVLLFAAMQANAQFIQNGTYGHVKDIESWPDLLVRFDGNRFETTDYREGRLQYGKGTWRLQNGTIVFTYDSIAHPKSYVRIVNDPPLKETKRILIYFMVYNGFDQKPVRNSGISFYDSLDKEMLTVFGDTAGKVSVTVDNPALFKKARAFTYYYRDHSPVLDLTGREGQNLYVQFLMNLDEGSYKKPSTEVFLIQQTRMGDLILTDTKTKKETVLNQNSWKTGL